MQNNYEHVSLSGEYNYIQIHDGMRVNHNGETVAIIKRIEGLPTFDDINKIQTSKNRRLAQIQSEKETYRTNDVVFGYRPSRPLFGHVAGQCKSNIEQPESWLKLKGIAQKLWENFKGFEAEYTEHTLATDHANKEFLIPGTRYTQLVVNRSNQLGAHYDQDNVDGTWSAMFYTIKGTTGGELLFPHYKIGIIPANEHVIYFKGYKHLHGVAPIRRVIPDGERFSIVFYANKKMCQTESVAVEKAKFNKSQLQRILKK